MPHLSPDWHHEREGSDDGMRAGILCRSSNRTVGVQRVIQTALMGESKAFLQYAMGEAKYNIDIIHSYPSYLDEVLGIASKDRVEDEVVQVSMLRREVVIVVDKILNVVVRANILHILE